MTRHTCSHETEKEQGTGMNEPVDSAASNASWEGDLDSISDVSQDIERQSVQQTVSIEKCTQKTPQNIKRTVSNVLTKVISTRTAKSLPELAPPPDGGTKAWTQVAMGFLVVFCTWGYMNAFGSFQTYYTESMPEISPSAISWIGSVQTFLSLILGVFSGRMVDAGFFLPTFIVGATLQVLGIFLMSVSTKYWHLMLTQGVLTGLGSGIFFTPTLALVTTYFGKRRGFAVGLVTMGNSTGGAIYPVIARQLLPTVGFGWTARIMGFVNLSFLLLAAIFMRPRLPPRKSGPIIDLSAFKEPVYVAFTSGLFFVMWANYYTFYYIASFGREALGLSYASASILIIVLNGAALPFRLIVPLCADHVGPVNALIPVLFLWFIVTFCWLAVKNVPGYYVFTAFYGIMSGSLQALIATSVASITPRLDMLGTRLGMVFGILSFASLTGPPIGGALQGATHGSYTAPQAWAASVTAD
ncbi:hypothetical protein BP6252_05589 [Coleophoma cylindrospora]|uniref:Major facilitator superfamily (MFS) profile domain-containing protein n=1 Tax=Coleophoma cylindrospora TaxID=1849047 RepID=A0A3D8RU85_9HELO|nr:hypothetical protein BP6252_05589 [Coleophoma cylindrospora]